MSHNIPRHAASRLDMHQHDRSDTDMHQHDRSNTDTPQRVIRIAAAVIVDDAGRVLLVRKRGTDRFMQAGGKIDPGESASEAVVRELEEELGLVVDAAVLDYWGRFTAVAANELDHVVDAEAFFLALPRAIASSVAAAAEIEELVWAQPNEALALPLAPLTRDILLPRLAAGRATGGAVGVPRPGQTAL
jgi:8-oxo-dGTP diphosphatase